MNVALCISGMPRTFRKTFHSIEKNILKRYSPDVFISTWDCKDKDDQWHVDEDPLELIDFYKPKRWDIELYNKDVRDSFGAMFKNVKQFQRADRIVPMYYKICRSFSHMREFSNLTGKKYDVIIRYRPDMYFKQNFVIPDIKPNNIYFPKNYINFGVSDVFFLCPQRVAEEISGPHGVYNKIFDLTLYEGNPYGIHAEYLLHLFFMTYPVVFYRQYLDLEVEIER